MSKHTPIPSILRPLGLTQLLATPDKRLDATPLFDVLLIIAMFFVLGSRFVFAPGLSVALPVSPVSDLGGISTVDVLTVKSRDFIIYRETKYTLSSLEKSMTSATYENPPRDAYLLVRADEGVDMETFIAISKLARVAGYSGVQLAAREPEAGVGQVFEEEVPKPSLFR
ncbi:MAG: ExbD/TolR family protein [Puniceicoccales bacterium]